MLTYKNLYNSQGLQNNQTSINFLRAKSYQKMEKYIKGKIICLKQT